jgi:hypothetical protein
MNRSKTGRAALTTSWAIVALQLLLFTTSARATDKPPSQGTIGTGTFSCAKFGKYDGSMNNAAQMNMVVQWVWGFMSAYNARAAFSPTYQDDDAPNPVAPPDAASTLQFIRTHCEKNPQSNVANAALGLITTLGGIVTSSISFPAGTG